MLLALSLHYSDERFNRLYKAVDLDCDNKIKIGDLNRLLFGSDTVKARRCTELSIGLGNDAIFVNSNMNTIQENEEEVEENED